MGWCWDRLHRLPFPAQLALLAGAHYLTARLGLAFGRLDGIVAPVWPPSGVALVGLLLVGLRAWPAIAVSALAVDLSGSMPAGTALGMATGTTLEAVVAVVLLRRAGFRPTLDRLRDIGALAGLAAVVASAGAALIGAASLAAGGLASGGFGEAWRVWWLGDILGMLVVAPALLTLLGPRSPAPAGRAERVAMAAVFAAVSLLAFTADAVPHYLLFPLMAWTAARSGPAGAALATALATVIGVVRTTGGAGPFAGADPIPSLHRLDGFLAVLALSGLALAVSVRERNRAQADLRRSLGDLEARVAERTRALAADRERLAEAQRIARLGSWEWDLVAGEATCSDEMLRIYGIPSRRDSRFTLEAYMAQVHPDDRASVADAVGRAIREGTGLTNEHRILVGRARLVRWIRCFVQVTVDGTGAVVRLTGTNQDITERKQAEERFRELLEAAPDAMLIVDSDFRLSLVNRQAEALLGYPRAELIGQPLEMLIPERFRQSHVHHCQAYFVDPAARTMGEGNELFALRRDGTEIAVEITLSPLQTDSGRYVSAAVRDVTRRKETEDQLAHQAMHDSLTHLPNRTLLTDRLTHALARAGRAGTEVAVLFLDLDRFKLLNDSLGHAAGDDVLVAVADRLRGAIRSADTVARIGGDEFVVVCDDAGEAPALAQRIAEVFEEPFAAGGTKVHLTVSLGMATSGPRRRSPEGLLADADAAMYRAKERGRARVECFDETMRSAAAARLESQHALHRAIDQREFRVFYQPIVNLRTGRVDTVEALVRWEHADRGIVGPTEFIPIAEESGLIVPLGTWVLREAAHQHRRWREQHPDLRLSVNLSARELRQPDLVASVQATLGLTDLDPRMLTMELTESVLMEDLDVHHNNLPDLRALGIQLAIDDFGTGYSSLTYLRRFPVDTLKIDESVVSGLSRDAAEGAVVESVVELAHALGLRVVAEGVEDSHQVEVLRRLGCDDAQGFHFARPQPAEAVGLLLGRTFLPTRVEPAASGAA